MRARRTPARCLSAGLLLGALPLVCAGQNSASAPGTPQRTPAATLHAGAQLVILDVSVQDSAGHPVHGLKVDDFKLTEQKKPQTPRYFEEHTASADQKPGPAMPPLPAGIFTDYTPFAPDSTLNILLIDALNTPMEDQIFVREQLLDFLKHEKPGMRTAIFGLTNRLILLQGFTSDPAALEAAVQHKLLAHASILLDHPRGVDGQDGSDAMGNAAPAAANSAYAQAAASLRQFEAEEHSLHIQLRQQYTLDAFNTLAHYLSNLPGRKNLLWFSGAFPLEIEPNATIEDPLAVLADTNQEFRETTNLLTAARTAVYPIDARGLMTSPMFDASNRGATTGPALAAASARFSAAQAAEHMTMNRMASDTGGQAFYNTNGLWQAAQKALEAGSDYYTLAYIPSNRNWNGAYRNIHIELTGAYAAQGYRLSYRHGYYADNPERPPKQAPSPGASAAAGVAAAAVADRPVDAYSHAAIARGAPAPSDIMFKVRVVPLTGRNDDAVAADNRPDAGGKMRPPYRTYAIDFVALPGDFSVTAQSDGRHTGKIEFTTFVYDADGSVLNLADKTVTLDLTPESYKEFLSNPVRFQLMVSAPVKQESFLRVVLRDVPVNHYGVVEIPTAEVGNLPPLQAQNPPAAQMKPGESAGAPPPRGKQ